MLGSLILREFLFFLFFLGGALFVFIVFFGEWMGWGEAEGKGGSWGPREDGEG
jgi:hypothetical protein